MWNIPGIRYLLLFIPGYTSALSSKIIIHALSFVFIHYNWYFFFSDNKIMFLCK